MEPRVREILSWYGSDNPGTLTNLARLLNQGKLGGSGRLVILPVDQGVEHGPARSFVPNPPAFDPRYHFELALEAGLNAYAAPLGFLEAGARDYAGELPLILKLNNRENLASDADPLQAVTGSVEAALRLGCAAIGYTVYPGSARRVQMYEKLQALAEEAKRHGLVVVVWSYPRGSDLSKEGETALDVSAYAAQIAAQLGAHIIKVKPPDDFVEQDEASRRLRESRHPHLDPGRARRPRGAVRLRRPPGHHLLRGTRQGHRRGAGGDPRHPRRGGVRVDHGAERFSAGAGGGAGVAGPSDRDLPGEVVASGRAHVPPTRPWSLPWLLSIERVPPHLKE